MDTVQSQTMLIEASLSYKLILTNNLLNKIEYICSKLPTLEWSGTLFYKVEGSFKNKDLCLTGVDLLLQDIGSQAATEFTPSTEVGFYIAQNNLMDCQLALIHSHNTMATFFSGTDKSTLLSEGLDRNHFLSLIVNNAGVYTAKITRQISYNSDIVFSYKYNTFGNEEITESNLTKKENKVAVEAFPLEIIKEGREFQELDEVINSLTKAKEAEAAKHREAVTSWCNNYGTVDPQSSFQFPSIMTKPKISEKSSWIPKDYKDYTDDDKEQVEEIDYKNTPYNADAVKKIVICLLKGTPLVTKYQRFTIEECAKYAESQIDSSFDAKEYLDFASSLVEYLFWNTDDNSTLSIEEDQAILAYHVSEELNKLKPTPLINVYLEIIDAYII